MQEFKFYEDQEEVPTFKEMSCYFSVPFLGLFDESNNTYIIIGQDKNDEFWINMYCPSILVGHEFAGAEYRYQTDEFSLLKTKEDIDNELVKLNLNISDELLNQLTDYNFSNEPSCCKGQSL